MMAATRQWTLLACGACALAVLAFAPVASAAAHSFDADLQLGDSGEAVRELQIFLNAHGCVLAPSGPGAPGQETDYFGPLTEAALECFQGAYALPQTGYFGPLTRALADAIVASIPVSSPIPTSNPPGSTPAPVDGVSSTSLEWMQPFDAHAPDPSWTPGFGGGGALAAQPAAAPDTTPPSVSLTAPANGATLAGTVALAASASDDVGVAGVQFQVDGANIGSPIASSPYVLSWDSSGVSDGAHTLSAIASDAAGNAASASVGISTLNAALVITGIFSNVTSDTSASITWITNQAASTKVVYGHDTSYSFSATGATSTAHAVDLTGLSGGVYHFEVVSTNAAGVTATSSDQQFVILILG